VCVCVCVCVSVCICVVCLHRQTQQHSARMQNVLRPIF
jgi:hypothetical protein